MKDRFFISDMHFGHENTTNGTFKALDGSNLRPFSSAQEMDEEMVKRWNETVGEYDRVYVLGDCVIARRHLETLGRLNGKKRLIRGNHDIFKDDDYRKYFESIDGVRVLEDCILSHIPLHPECVTARFGVNVHGHLHGNRLMIPAPISPSGYDGRRLMTLPMPQIPDPRYFSVCVEQIDYRPIEYTELRQKMRAQFAAAKMPLPPRLHAKEA